jgi:hypothetical protein
MYSGDIIWQLPDYLRLIKFIALKFLALTNNFIMSSSSDITSDLTSAFISLDSYLDTITKNLDSADLINQEARTTRNTSPLSTASSDYFAILEEVEKQTLIEAACLDIQYSKDIDECLAQHNATAIGLLINIVRAAELVECTARILPNPRHTSILLHLQRRIRNLAIRLMPDDAKTIIHEVVHEVCECIIKNPVLRPHSPNTPLPVPLPVDSAASASPEDITPGLRTMSLSTMAALQVLQETAPPLNEPAHPLRRTHRRHSSGNTRRTRVARASAPSPPDLINCNRERSVSPTPTTASRVTIIITDPDNNFVCHHCCDPGHHHKNCPKYHCRVCRAYAPGHFSVFCKQLKGEAVLPINWKDPEFYSTLARWEADRDAADLCVTEEQDTLLHRDYDCDHTLYDNTD